MTNRFHRIRLLPSTSASSRYDTSQHCAARLARSSRRGRRLADDVRVVIHPDDGERFEVIG
jgi:hypothetical protein